MSRVRDLSIERIAVALVPSAGARAHHIADDVTDLQLCALSRELLVAVASLGQAHAESVYESIMDDRTLGEITGPRAARALRDWWQLVNGERLAVTL